MPDYLDHNATTPVDKRVFEAMVPYLREHFGNPSSVHRFGRQARMAIETAREQIADLVAAHPSQVIFTSGGTEANNLAINGTTAALEPGWLAVSAIEHPSVTAAAAALARSGWKIHTLDVDSQGRVSRESLDEALKSCAKFVSIMMANNETGVIQDIGAVSEVVRASGAVMHTDAVQAAGKIPVDFESSGAHLLSLSAHKINGPKGVGALIVDKNVKIQPILYGGGHERGRRAGTENVAGIVGFGAAAELAKQRQGEYKLRFTDLRQRLESGLRAIGDIEIFSGEVNRLPNTVCFAVNAIGGEALQPSMEKADMAVSSGSACSSGSGETSPVLRAMKVAPDLARSALRVSLGWGNAEPDVDKFILALGAEIERLRQKPKPRISVSSVN